MHRVRGAGRLLTGVLLCEWTSEHAKMMRMPVRLLPLFLLLAGCGTSTCPQDGSAASGPQAQKEQAPSQGESWAAIGQLPDWSETWATTDASRQAAIQECCLGNGEALHLTPKYAQQRIAAGEGEKNNPGGSNLNNAVTCTPIGVPGVLNHPMLFEFLFTPGKVTMLFVDGEVRRINTAKGATHIPEDERQYPPSGDSTGHWDGGTLVVDTVGISPQSDIFISNGIHTTTQTHVEERMFLTPAGLLQIDTTVTDPAIFEQPYRYSRTYQRLPGDFDPGCSQNNRDNGTAPPDLTPPP